MSRPPVQTGTAFDRDLKHLSLALDRAQRDTTRNKTTRTKVVKLLSDLVAIYTKERLTRARKGEVSP